MTVTDNWDIEELRKQVAIYSQSCEVCRQRVDELRERAKQPMNQDERNALHAEILDF